MSTENKTISSHMMAPLVQKYLQRLQERDLEIKALLEHAEQQDFTPAAREQLRHYAHNLSGSGATYGYPNISNAGRALEEAIDAHAPGSTVIALAKALLENVRVVMVGGDSSRQATGQATSVMADMNTNVRVPNLSKKTLLVIDDDPDTSKLIGEL